MMNFILKMMDFILKMMSLSVRTYDEVPDRMLLT